MPTYYDNENHKGVRIIVEQKNMFIGIKTLKKYSKPIAVGDTVNIRIIINKLNDFDEEYWGVGKPDKYCKIYEMIPGRNNKNICKIEFDKNGNFAKDFKSPIVTIEGDIEYKIIPMTHGYPGSVFKELYSAKAENKDWKR